MTMPAAAASASPDRMDADQAGGTSHDVSRHGDDLNMTTAAGGVGDSSLWLQKSITLPDPLPDLHSSMLELYRSAPPDGAARSARENVSSFGDGGEPAVDESETMPAPTPLPPPSPPQQQQPMSESQRMMPPSMPSSWIASTMASTSQAVEEVSSQRSTPTGLRGAGLVHEFDFARGRVEGSMLRQVPRPSGRQPSRMPSVMGGVGYVSAQEYDDIRNRLSQTLREKLKLVDTGRELELTRLELNQVRSDCQTFKDYSESLRAANEESTLRAEREAKAKQEVETKLFEETLAHNQEVQFLKRQLEEVRSETSERIAKVTVQLESENASRVQQLSEDNARLGAEVDELGAQLEETTTTCGQLREECSRLKGESQAARQEAAAVASALDDLRRQQQLAHTTHEIALQKLESEYQNKLNHQQNQHSEVIRRITSAKDGEIAELTAGLASAKEKIREVQGEAERAESAYRATLQRLREEHQHALSEQSMRSEAAVEEALGHRRKLEGEAASMRSTYARVVEELTAVTAQLALQERRAAELEKTVAATRSERMDLEEKLASATSDCELTRQALEETDMRLQRLMDERDTTEAELSSDIQECRMRIRKLEDELLTVKGTLSQERQKHIHYETTHRSDLARLKTDLEAATSYGRDVQRLMLEKKNSDERAEEYRGKYAKAMQRVEHLELELAAMTTRCTMMEKQMAGHASRAMHAASRGSLTPKKGVSEDPPPGVAASGAAPMGSVATAAGAGVARESSHHVFMAGLGSGLTRQPLQPTRSTNIPLTPRCNSSKRPRSTDSEANGPTEAPRVFAITGFDGTELIYGIKSLPNVAVAESRSNAPVPGSLTHLVTNGQLTIKLLTALARGCWVVPDTYVYDSIKAQRCLDEADYGFRHEHPPLQERRVAFTEAFKASRHYDTASLIAIEGGAVVVNDEAEADFVLAMHSEQADLVNAITWDKMVEILYPVKVGGVPSVQ